MVPMDTWNQDRNHWEAAGSPPLPSTNSTSRLSITLCSSQDRDLRLSGHRDGNRLAESDMSYADGTSNRHKRRRRSYTDEEVEAGKLSKELLRESRKSSDTLSDDEEHKTLLKNPEEGDMSNQSFRSTSEDMEMDKMASEFELTDDEETGLTEQDESQRRQRKRRNSLLNERVTGGDKTSKHERKLADINVLKNSAINALLIGLWYLFSLSISIYNKWMFSPDHLDFHFPLFTTCMHMLVQFSLASAVLFLIPRFRPRADSIENPHNIPQNQTHNKDPSEPKKPLMTVQFYLSRIGPCGAATGLDIGLGNMSLKFISLTFFTMCKSSALAFVLLFAFLFHLETPSLKLILIIFTMTIGVIMMVAGETAFNALGFALIISSAFFSGFRWALTQILLLRNPATSNPFSSIFFLAPVMFLSLAILAIPIEGFGPLGEGLQILTMEKGIFQGIGLLLFPGILAFCMTASEFALLKRTSVVTLSICGIFKEVVTISAAGIVFHDPLTPINVSGLIVTIASIAGYNYIKITKMRSDARAKVVEMEGEEERAVEVEAMLTEAEERRASVGSRAERRLSLALGGKGAGARELEGEAEAQVRMSPTKRSRSSE